MATEVCQKCGYDLSGLALQGGAACPECGAVQDELDHIRSVTRRCQAQAVGIGFVPVGLGLIATPFAGGYSRLGMFFLVLPVCILVGTLFATNAFTGLARRKGVWFADGNPKFGPVVTWGQSLGVNFVAWLVGGAAVHLLFPTSGC